MKENNMLNFYALEKENNRLKHELEVAHEVSRAHWQLVGRLYREIDELKAQLAERSVCNGK